MLVKNLKEREHYEDLGMDGRALLKWNLKRQDERVCPGFNWHKIETSGRIF
jgi:hypothetical protein